MLCKTCSFGFECLKRFLFGLFCIFFLDLTISGLYTTSHRDYLIWDHLNHTIWRADFRGRSLPLIILIIIICENDIKLWFLRRAIRNECQTFALSIYKFAVSSSGTRSSFLRSSIRHESLMYKLLRYGRIKRCHLSGSSLSLFSGISNSVAGLFYRLRF